MAGTIGLLRFPDLYSRLHAVTKADNLGLGLIVLGLLIYVGNVLIAIKLLIIWFLALLSGSSACYLIAHAEGQKQNNVNKEP
jgi:multicomponent Na+:H+ antiporter subunit G